MVWARFDDRWTDRTEWLALTFEQRAHLFALIVFCCRMEVWTGELRAVDARRVSDVPDPDGALAALADAGFLERIPTGWRIVDIEEHVPSESVRAKTMRERLRGRRRRAHAKGNHVLCDASNCDVLRGASIGRSTGQSGIASGTGTGTGEPTSTTTREEKKKTAGTDTSTDADSDEYVPMPPAKVGKGGGPRVS